MTRSSILHRAWPLVVVGLGAAHLAPWSESTTPSRRPSDIVRDEARTPIVRPPKRERARRAGMYINANGSMPCAPRAGEPFPWEEPSEAIAEMPDALVLWNPCTGNLQLVADAGLTYNTQYLFNANPPPYPSTPLGGPTGWNWNVAWNMWITPTANGAVLTDGGGTPYTFARASTSGSTEYYVDQQLSSWNLVHDGAAQVWRLQLMDGGELDFTQQAHGVQLSSVKNKVGTEMYRIHFNADGTLDSVTDHFSPPRNVVRYTYYPSTDPSAGRIRTITPLDGYAFTIVYQESTFGDIAEIRAADGGGCKFKYVSHMLMQMNCADQEWLFDVYQNGGLVNVIEPNGTKHNVQYNPNPDGTTDVQWSSPNRNVPAATMTFTKGDNQDPTKRPWVKQFVNRLGIAVAYDRTNPPAMSQPGPLTSFTDQNGKLWKYGYDYPANDPTGGIRYIQRPAPNDAKHLFDIVHCTATTPGCPTTPTPGVPMLVAKTTYDDGTSVAYQYYADAIGSAKYHEIQTANTADPNGGALDGMAMAIDVTNGVLSTSSVNGVPLESQRSNGTLTFLTDVQDIAGSEKRTPSSFEMLQAIDDRDATGGPLYAMSLGFDDKDVFVSGGDDYEMTCVDKRDDVGRPTMVRDLAPSGSCAGGLALLTIATTYPPIGQDRGSAQGESVTGPMGVAQSWNRTVSCDDDELVSSSLNGVQDQVTATYPECSSGPPPDTDGGAPEAGTSDSGSPDSGGPPDSGAPPCTPGCKSQINIYFYQACCIEYDSHGQIIKNQLVQAAVCTSPDAQNNLCYSWDDNSSSPANGTWGSNCPTGGPDPCFPYEN